MVVIGLDDGRKDTYGVYAEPVDPEEVCGFFLLLNCLSWFWNAF